MSIWRQASVLALIGAGSFGGAYAIGSTASEQPRSVPSSAPAANATDSAKLAAMGIQSGPRLIVYVLLASRCSQCQEPDTKDAVRSLRARISAANGASFSSLSIVGVALDASFAEGLEYLQEVGLDTFDEISIGNAWLNENVSRFVWKEQVAAPAVPQVIITSSVMSARADPLTVSFDNEAVVAVVRGRIALTRWVDNGAALETAQNMSSEREARVP